ncbi:MAG: hypothetical protein COA43_15590 [Robiginitomaculum sp.]|nr:MAG: hypothetical protein COA43_15590 [Robiginitomaculum sp.]
MSWQRLIEEKSALAAALDLVGDHWTLMIITGCFNGVNRFNQLERHLGINRNLLKSRLDRLVEAGMFMRQPYGGSATRFEYIPTDMCWRLRPVIIGLAVWGEENLTKEETLMTNIHQNCGGLVKAIVQCEACGENVGHDEIALKLYDTGRNIGIDIVEGVIREI